MNLPYQKTEAFSLNGKLYPDEKAVLLAAVEKILGEGAASTAISKACELAPILGRVCEISGTEASKPPQT